ncbi:hypothetical protein [Nocardia sp. NBC_01327]|uniref:hypothetical protein n=1 Tax=Nocardia sp. NBC_01327 TaxID=2903593 RepID=UPI002E111527|nr:hypothetical protein OG326_23725 [Nocardia sp. NBC_01327]
MSGSLTENTAAEPDWWTTPWHRSNPKAPIGPTQRRLLGYLAAHSDQDFKLGALAKALDIHPSRASSGSHGLVNRGLAEVT